MRVRTFLPILVAVIAALFACDDESTSPRNSTSPVAVMETSMGIITIELLPEKAPQTVANFRRYASEHFYDGLIFHRVIANFMDQGGGFSDSLVQKPPTYPPIPNEAGNGLSHVRGAVGMARTSVVNSAASQFFINQKDNPFLDHKDDTPQGFGYCVFGRVVEGMDVVDAINAVPTGARDGFNDVPVTNIYIQSVTIHD